MSILANKKCIPCSSDSISLNNEEMCELKKEISSDWSIVNNHHLERVFKFKNFKEALIFTNKVGEIAEMENHHPDIYLAWGEVKISIWTHKINGLLKSDFIFAAKCDEI